MIVDLEIDVVGLRCPLPVLKLKKRIEPIQPGSVVKLLTNDPTTLKDVPAYCELAGHLIISMVHDSSPYEFIIRKAGHKG